VFQKEKLGFFQYPAGEPKKSWDADSEKNRGGVFAQSTAFPR
jgi:hypothetical protein